MASVRLLILSGIVVACAQPASAAFAASASSATGPLDFVFSTPLSDSDYKNLARAVVRPTRFEFFTSAAPTGLIGFDAGIALTYAPIRSLPRAIAKAALVHGDAFPSGIFLPRVTVQKGLPFGLDVAANLSLLPWSSLKLVGGALQMNLLDGPSPVPSISVRAGYTTLFGENSFGAGTGNVEAIASVGIPPILDIVTPYAGLGAAFSAADSDFSVSMPATLQGLPGSVQKVSKKARWMDTYVTLGSQFALLPFFRLLADVQITGDEALYSAKVSATF